MLGRRGGGRSLTLPPNLQACYSADAGGTFAGEPWTAAADVTALRRRRSRLPGAQAPCRHHSGRLFYRLFSTGDFWITTTSILRWWNALVTWRATAATRFPALCGRRLPDLFAQRLERLQCGAVSSAASRSAGDERRPWCYRGTTTHLWYSAALSRATTSRHSARMRAWRTGV